MKAICYVLIKLKGAKVKRTIRAIQTWEKREDSILLEAFAPGAGMVSAWAAKGWTLSNWHIVDYEPKPKRKLSPPKFQYER